MSDLEPTGTSRDGYAPTRASKGASGGKGLSVLRKAIQNRFGSGEPDDIERETDLLAETFCPECETTAALDETNIDDDTGWLQAKCECGKVEMGVRVAPWPRDDMIRVDGEWRFEGLPDQPIPRGPEGDTHAE